MLQESSEWELSKEDLEMADEGAAWLPISGKGQQVTPNSNKGPHVHAMHLSGLPRVKLLEPKIHMTFKEVYETSHTKHIGLIGTS